MPNHHPKTAIPVLVVLALFGHTAGAWGPLHARNAQTGYAYYVSKGGDDNNPGSIGQPWANCPGMPGWSGTATLGPGDTVYFDSGDTWSASSGSAILQVTGGVTYDGSSWGSGTRATLRADGALYRSVISFMDDDPAEATVVRGFEVDAGGYETTGIGINWPQASGSLTGATKRIEDCVVHDTFSLSGLGSYEYGIVVSSGYSPGGNRHVSNVEVLDCVTYNISRGGINIYAANDHPSSGISNVLVRGNETYAIGQDPNYAGSSLAAKNHIVNAIFEYNVIRDAERGPGIGISTHAAGFTGPENLTIRHNIIANSPHAGFYVQGAGDKSLEIYGNLVVNSAYEAMTFSRSLADALSVRVTNNTFYQNYAPQWGSEIRIHDSDAAISTFEFSNNIIVSDADSRCLIDDENSLTGHTNNIYYRPTSDDLVIAGDSTYDAGDVNTWEPTALTGDPLFTNPSNLPTGFAGTFGVDMAPNTDGLNLTGRSPALDGGATLDAAFGSSINSVWRPGGARWDIGAYEVPSSLALSGTPGDRALDLAWRVHAPLSAGTTWHIDYYTHTATAIYTATQPLSPTRSTVLTEHVRNYQWYTITLYAMDGPTPILSDTVRVMPTDIVVYLPVAKRRD